MATTTAEVGLSGALGRFRTCPVTGLKVEATAERLIKVNLVTSVIFLGIGGLFGLLVALTRWPAVHILPVDLFYLVLTAHGLDVLIVWVIFFEVAMFYFACTYVLNCRLATPKLAWVAYVLMLVGALVTNVAVIAGDSSVMFTSYVPLQASPNFYLGIILFAVGALLTCFIFFGTLVIAREERTYEGSIPLVTFGVMTGVIIMVFTLASGAIIIIPTWLWSLGYIPSIDTVVYKLVWWGMGHSSQQVNVSVHVAVWYAIIAIVIGAKTLSEKVSRTAFFLYIMFLQLASAHHMLVEPGLSSEWKVFNTSYAMYLAVLGSMIHGLTVPGAVEAAQRRLGYDKGVFEWLRKAPWDRPAFAAMFLSLILFGFLGGISGVVLGTEQINLMMHNTLYVPGHFHATVVTGTTLAFMGMTYLLLPLFFRRKVIWPRLARWQPYLFGLGAAGISLFMMGAGTLGVPRRSWDITASDAVLSYDFQGLAYLLLGLNGLSALIATAGGVLFVLITLGTVLKGERVDESTIAAELSVVPGRQFKEAVSTYGGTGFHNLTGTYILVTVFFTAFVLYYFVNWKYLSELWLLG